jgi:NADH-quinone oxidoreductase subunit J
MTPILFLAFALTVLACGLMVILHRNPVTSALFLVLTFCALAGLYLLLQAEFLAMVQVIVYAGAIMVLFVFAIMVLIPGKEETGPDPRRRYRVLAIPLGLALLAELSLIVARRGGASRGPGTPGGVETIGRLLFTDYLFPFELTSVLLLAAMVGVLLLARRRV